MFPRVLLTAFAGMMVCAGSFFGSLAVFDYLSSPSASSAPQETAEIDRVESLKAKLIYDEASLLRAAELANLQRSESLRGTVDSLQRLPDGHVSLLGWAADLKGDGTPIRILAFAKGKPILQAETSGERPDVTAAYKLQPDLARNVKFDLKASCNPREALVVAAATKTNTILPLRITTCP